MEQSSEKLALHFKYCGFIAVMIVVAIATERWSTSKDFTTYLSNAATMTSLLLGVVAIFYSFISNDGMSRSLGSITLVSTEVRETREDIKQFSKLTQDATRESQSNTASVQKASSDLSQSLGLLSGTLGQLSEQNDALKNLISALPTRMDQLEAKFGDVAKAVGEKPQPAQPPQATDAPVPVNIDRFLARASLTQNLLSHACVHSYSSKKPLSIPMFCAAIEYNGPSGYIGFLSCMHAAQLCFRKLVDGQAQTYTVSSVNPELAKLSRLYFVEYIEQNYADKPDEKALWLKKLTAVEALFA